MLSFEYLNIEEDTPIYLQIIQYVKRGLVAGTIQYQDEVPSRRMLSALLGVNPNTVQKAYKILEDEGIIVSRTGAKSFIVAGEDKVCCIREELLQKETQDWIRAMKQMQVSYEEAEHYMKELWRKCDE